MSTAMNRLLDGLNYTGSRDGLSYQCRCPIHDDRRESLSITRKSDGMILVYCHAGYQTEAIVAHRQRQSDGR